MLGGHRSHTLAEIYEKISSPMRTRTSEHSVTRVPGRMPYTATPRRGTSPWSEILLKQNLVKKFRTTESVLDNKRTWVKRVLTEEMLDEIGHRLERSPTTSSRRVAQQNQSDSLMAAIGDCHHLCKLMAPVRHRWSISDDIGEIRNTVAALMVALRTLLLAPVLPTVMVVVHKELALFTVQIGKSLLLHLLPTLMVKKKLNRE
ncbi:hypothetical protein ANN_14062 [Periplaneta americana]|uniref:Uncharacterized protein n=1 Tax=Periplaneta americana TaxID=6978 RepID=A0ABQ8SWG6_PERAM|nr:hypothetical protein ANN_14062 [Periplaneta americana]